MRSVNHYGEILTERYFILPADDDYLSMPIIKTPCYLTDSNLINLTFSTQEDAKVHERGCPVCGCDTIFATLSTPLMNVSHWVCLCGHRWDTDRGIYYHATRHYWVNTELIVEKVEEATSSLHQSAKLGKKAKTPSSLHQSANLLDSTKAPIYLTETTRDYLPNGRGDSNN